MNVSNEKIVEKTIEIITEAFKGGLITLFTTYAQLLRKNLQLENELKRLHLIPEYSSEMGSEYRNDSPLSKMPFKYTSNSILQNEVQQQNMVFNSSYRRKSEKNSHLNIPTNSSNHVKETIDSFVVTRKKCKEKSKNGFSRSYKDPYASHPLAGCHCDICKSLCLNKHIRKCKLKASSQDLREILNLDNIWATYRGRTVCEIIYIGHKREYKYLWDQNCNKNRVVGAVIRLSNEGTDSKELFVSLQDLYSVKSCKSKKGSVRLPLSPDDSGFEASCTNGFSFLQPSFTEKRIDSEASKNINTTNGQQMAPLNPNFLSPFDKSLNKSCNGKGDAFKVSCPSMPSCRCRHIRCLEQPEKFCKVETSRRKASLQEPSANYVSHFREFSRRRTSDTWDSAISLSCRSGLTEHSCSNLELGQCSNRIPAYGSVNKSNELFTGCDECNHLHQRERHAISRNRCCCQGYQDTICRCNVSERQFCSSGHHCIS